MCCYYLHNRIGIWIICLLLFGNAGYFHHVSLFIVSMSIQLEQSRAVNQLDTFQV